MNFWRVRIVSLAMAGVMGAVIGVTGFWVVDTSAGANRAETSSQKSARAQALALDWKLASDRNLARRWRQFPTYRVIGGAEEDLEFVDAILVEFSGLIAESGIEFRRTNERDAKVTMVFEPRDEWASICLIWRRLPSTLTKQE